MNTYYSITDITLYIYVFYKLDIIDKKEWGVAHREMMRRQREAIA